MTVVMILLVCWVIYLGIRLWDARIRVNTLEKKAADQEKKAQEMASQCMRLKSRCYELERKIETGGKTWS